MMTTTTTRKLQWFVILGLAMHASALSKCTLITTIYIVLWRALTGRRHGTGEEHLAKGDSPVLLRLSSVCVHLLIVWKLSHKGHCDFKFLIWRVFSNWINTALHLSLIVCVVAPHPSAGAKCPSLLLYSYWPTCLCLIAPPCSQFTLRPVLLNNHRPMSCCSKWPRRPARTISRLSSSARPKESLLPSMYTIRHLM